MTLTAEQQMPGQQQMAAQQLIQQQLIAQQQQQMAAQQQQQQMAAQQAMAARLHVPAQQPGGRLDQYGRILWKDAVGKEHAYRVAAKKQTGHQKKLATLTALFITGEMTVLAQELNSLASFYPLQEDLQHLMVRYQELGIEAFYREGYLARPQ